MMMMMMMIIVLDSQIDIFFRVKNIGKRYPANYGKYSPEILHIIAQKHDFDQVHGK